jgi:hypothetical protein
VITVQVPGPAQDRPPWKSVAIIAAVGFVVGVAWPRLAGVRLGPSLPEAPSASPAASVSAPPAPAAPPAPTAVLPAAAPAPVASALPSAVAAVASAAPPAPVSTSAPTVSVTAGTVQSCKTPDGDILKGAGDCGRVQGLDGLVLPRLRKLADCPEAADASGRLPLVVRADFARGAISVDLGRGASLASADALLACAKANIAGANLSRLSHDNPRYSVGYVVTFGSGTRTVESAAAPARPAPDSADGTVQVVWEVAIVRDVPKTGKVLARLQRGTQIRVGPVKDGWYPVQYGDGFASEGWVYRGAIGR